MPPPRTRSPPLPCVRLLPLKVLFPLLLGVALSMGILVFSELGFRRLEAANRTMAVSLEMQSTLHEVLALIVDAETSQRGYLLTAQPEYLDPYRAALPKIDDRFNRLRALAAQHAIARAERSHRALQQPDRQEARRAGSHAGALRARRAARPRSS